MFLVLLSLLCSNSHFVQRKFASSSSSASPRRGRRASRHFRRARTNQNLFISCVVAQAIMQSRPLLSVRSSCVWPTCHRVKRTGSSLAQLRNHFACEKHYGKYRRANVWLKLNPFDSSSCQCLAESLFRCFLVVESIKSEPELEGCTRPHSYLFLGRSLALSLKHNKAQQSNVGCS